MSTTLAPVAFADLLQQAVTEPGLISTAYSQFHNFSFGNQLLALTQCLARGIQPGPMATFPKWRELNRHVRKGEKAITLCQPVTVKRRVQDDNDSDEKFTFTRFVYRPHWFVLAQTDGEDFAVLALPRWERARALTTLDVTEEAFNATNGNVMGYARGRTIAVSPLNPLAHKTTFHELAHVLLGHTADHEHNDGEQTPRDLRECEAESVAMLCCAALGLSGIEYSRGYIQEWWGAGNPIPERSAQKILKATDQILKAGRVESDSQMQS